MVMYQDIYFSRMEAQLRAMSNTLAPVNLQTSLLRFVLVGITNSCVGLATIWIAKHFLSAGDAYANAFGYVIGVAVSFFLNKQWTFAFRGGSAGALARFLVVFAVSYSANLLTVLTLIAATGHDYFLFQVFGMPPYSILFYLGCRWYAFAGTRTV